MAYLGLGRTLQRRETPAGAHHQDRQHPGASTAGRNIIAIAPAWGTRWRGAGAANRDASSRSRTQQRLCRRFRTLTGRQMPAPKVTVAIARELAGFVWAALQPEPAAANN